MLSDKISDLRRQAGWSQEELAERLDVSRQSVSKWESGASLPEVDKIIAMSGLFGVSTDFLLKDDVPEEAAEVAPMEAEPEVNEYGLRVLGAADVNRYLENRRQCAPQIAFATALCVACAAPLVALQGFAGAVFGLISENLVNALGVTLLLVMVAAAVGIYISAGMRMGKYDYVDKTDFALSDATRQAVQDQKRDFTPEYKQSIVHGVMLCVLSAVPVTAAGILDAERMVLLGAGALLVIVAAGVFLFVRDGMIMGSFDHILKSAERCLRRAMRRSR